LQLHPDGHVDGNAKMPMALKLSAMKSQDLQADAWRMVYDGKRPVQDLSQTIRHAYSTLKSSALKKRKAKEWMTVARDIDQHGDGRLNTS
jgi:hypothetical protein